MNELMQYLQGLGLSPEAIIQAVQMGSQSGQMPPPPAGGPLPLTPEGAPPMGDPGEMQPMPIGQADLGAMGAPPLPEMPPEPQYEQLPNPPEMAATPRDYERQGMSLGELGRVLTRFGAAVAQPTPWGGGLGASLARGANAATDAMEQLYSVRAQHQRQQIEDAYRRAQLARERNRDRREDYRDKVSIPLERYKTKASADRDVRRDTLEAAQVQGQLENWRALRAEGRETAAYRRQLRALGVVEDGATGAKGFMGSDGQFHPLPPGVSMVGGFGGGAPQSAAEKPVSLAALETFLQTAKIGPEDAANLRGLAAAGTLTGADLNKRVEKIASVDPAVRAMWQKFSEPLPPETGVVDSLMNLLPGRASTPAPAQPAAPQRPQTAAPVQPSAPADGRSLPKELSAEERADPEIQAIQRQMDNPNGTATTGPLSPAAKNLARAKALIMKNPQKYGQFTPEQLAAELTKQGAR